MSKNQSTVTVKKQLKNDKSVAQDTTVTAFFTDEHNDILNELVELLPAFKYPRMLVLLVQLRMYGMFKQKSLKLPPIELESRKTRGNFSHRKPFKMSKILKDDLDAFVNEICSRYKIESNLSAVLRAIVSQDGKAMIAKLKD